MGATDLARRGWLPAPAAAAHRPSGRRLVRTAPIYVRAISVRAISRPRHLPPAPSPARAISVPTGPDPVR
jgi:hypothetical protein